MVQKKKDGKAKSYKPLLKMLKREFVLKRRWTKDLMTEIIKAMNCVESTNEKTLLILYNHVKRTTKEQLKAKPYRPKTSPLVGHSKIFPALRKRVCISDRSHPNSVRVLFLLFFSQFSKRKACYVGQNPSILPRDLTAKTVFCWWAAALWSANK